MAAPLENAEEMAARIAVLEERVAVLRREVRRTYAVIATLSVGAVGMYLELPVLVTVCMAAAWLG